MSKVLQEKINELFEATKDLKSFDEIKPHCDRFNEWVSEQNYSEKSLGTLFSRYGLYNRSWGGERCDRVWVVNGRGDRSSIYKRAIEFG
jgi:hypothetical protein